MKNIFKKVFFIAFTLWAGIFNVWAGVSLDKFVPLEVKIDVLIIGQDAFKPYQQANNCAYQNKDNGAFSGSSKSFKMTPEDAEVKNTSSNVPQQELKVVSDFVKGRQVVFLVKGISSTTAYGYADAGKEFLIVASENGTDIVAQNSFAVTTKGANKCTLSGLDPTKTYYISFRAKTASVYLYAVKFSTAGSTPAQKSDDATLKELKYDGTSVSNFDAKTLDYSVTLPADYSGVPNVTAIVNDSKATLNITQAASATGKASVVVTAEDGSTQTYTITFNVKVPSSDLTTHMPGIYEAEKIAGGYGGTLSIFNGREYEVYYAARNASDLATFNTNGTDRTNGMTTNETTTACEAIDGWFKGTIASISSASASAKDEFTKGSSGREHRMENGHTYTFHFSGYDQFSIFAKDKKQDTKGTKPGDNQYFEVYIDGVLQPLQFNKDNYTIRRYSISTGEHVVIVKAINGQCRLLGFSLRVADEPRVSWIKGNDSTQNVLQTRLMAPVTYYTKYNSKGKTVLEWEGASATGISLNKGNSDGIGDTLTLSGTANCPVGTYIYKVVAYNLSLIHI